MHLQTSHTTNNYNSFNYITTQKVSGLNYEITDHLGNVRATIKNDGSGGLEVSSWADYYPFGEVLPGRNSNPTGMFGYQGQERISNATNEVSGSRWYNFQLRMYNPSLGRFNTIDPYSQFNSPYLAMANNPISFVDPDGGRARSSDYDDYGKLKLRRFVLEEQDREWWRQNRHYFRVRGGDHNGANFYYHMMNVELLGATIPVDNIDINSRGPRGDIYSGERNQLMGGLIASYNTDNERAEHLMAAQQAEAGAALNLMAMNIWSGNLAIMNKLDALFSLEGLGVIKRQEGAKESSSDRIVSIYSENADGKLTIVWDETYDDLAWQADYSSTIVEYWNGTQSFADAGGHVYDPKRYSKESGNFISDATLLSTAYVFGGDRAIRGGELFGKGTNLIPKERLARMAMFKLRNGVLLGIGRAVSGLSAINSGIVFSETDKSFGRAGQFGVSLISNGLTASKDPRAVGLGLTIGLIDYYGGFNSFYKTLDIIDFETKNRYLNAGNYIFNGAYFNK